MQLRAQMNIPTVPQYPGTSPQHSTEIPLPLQETLLRAGKRPGLAAQWDQNPADGCHLDGTGGGRRTFTLPAFHGHLALYRPKLKSH